MDSHFKDRLLKPIIGCSLGTFLEFLDFALYASLAPVFALKFFPKEYHEISIIYAWGIFAVSFIARPFSGLILGPIGDRVGIKKILLFSLAIMGFATTAIGVLPTYEQIGLLAPLLLILLRIIQGLAVSIEYNSLGVYLLQQNGIANKFGFYSSFTSVGVIAGLISGSLIVGLFLNKSSLIDIPDWQWRMPFISCGLVVSVLGIFLRQQMQGPHKSSRSYSERGVLKSLFCNQINQLFMAIFVTGFISISAYIAIGYMATYLQLYRNFLLKESILVCCACGIAMLIFVPIGGWISDKLGRTRFMAVSSLSMSIISILSMGLIAYGQSKILILGLLLLSINTGISAGGLPAFVTELFHSDHRYTGSTIAYNAGVAWIGGTAPMIISLLLMKTNNPMIPGIYLSFFSLLGFIAAMALNQRKQCNDKLRVYPINNKEVKHV